MKKGERIKVCKTMFLHTFAIDEKRVRTALHHVAETGTPKPDGRGRHGNHRREEQRERLANHNFTVTELDTMLTYCYFWSENECQKGSCEVAISLESFISKKK
ncbi:uncharacterized protein [Clytia hemisphaerica]|uniref:uncharacterized protein n=1 Tax=Clytia hemisphaerica TaxID=252671 RepID=UPI0034D6CEF1